MTTCYFDILFHTFVNVQCLVRHAEESGSQRDDRATTGGRHRKHRYHRPAISGRVRERRRFLGRLDVAIRPPSVTSQHRKKMSVKKHAYAQIGLRDTTRVSDRRRRSDRPPRGVRVHRSRCTCLAFGRTTILGISVVDVITGHFISNGLQ